MAKAQFQLTAELLLHPNAKSIRQTYNTINKKLRGAAVIHPDIRIGKRASNQLRVMEARLQGISRQSANTSAHFQKMGSGPGLTKVNRGLTQASRSARNFQHSIALASRRYAAFLVGGGTGLVALRKMFTFGKESIQFENSLLKIAQVSNKSLASMRPLGKQIRSTAKEYGIAADEIAKSLLVLKQAGFQNVGSFSGLFARAGKSPTFKSLDDVSNAIILLREGFKLKGVNEYEQALSNINTLSKNYAVESSDLVTALSKSGGAYANASKDVGQFLAIMTALRASTRETADTLSITMRSTIARLTRKANIELAQREMGVSLLTDQGGGVDPFTAFQRLAKAKQQANTPKKQLAFSQNLEKLFGLRQVARITSLLNNWKMAEEALLTARKNQDSLTQDAAIAQSALSTQYTKTTEAISTQFDSLIASSPFRTLTGESLEFTQQVVKMTSALSSLLPLLAVMGGAKLTSMAYMAGHLPGGRKPMSAFGYGKTSGIGGRPRMQVARAAIGRTMSRIGPAGGIGAIVGANYLASQMPESPTAQAAASATTTGVGLAMVGVNIFVAALAAATVGLKSFGKSLEDNELRTREERFKQGMKKLGLEIKSGGILGEGAISSFKNQSANLSGRDRASGYRSVSNFRGYTRALWTLQSVQDAKGQISKERKSQVKSQRQSLGDMAITMRDEIAKKVSTMKEFREFGGGLGAEVLKLGNELRVNFTKPLIESLGKQAKQVQSVSIFAQTGKMTVAHTALQNKLGLPNLVKGFSSKPLNLSADLQNIGTQKFAQTAQMFGQPLLQSVNKAHAQLPKLLSQSGFTQENFKDKILDSIDSNAIRKSVESKLEGIEFRQFSKSLADVNGLSKQLLSGFDSLVGSARKSASTIDAFSSRLIANLQNTFAAKTQFFNASSNIDALQLTHGKTLEQFGRGRVRGNAANMLIQNQAANIAGSSNVNQLQGQLAFHREQFQRTGDPEHIIAIKATTLALSKLADMSGRTSTTMEKLNRIQRDKANRENLAQGILTASPMDRMRMGMQLDAALRARAAGGFFGNFQQNTQAMQGLDMLGDRGQKIKSELLTKTLPGLLGGVNKQEKQTQNNVLSIQKDSIAASQAITQHLKIQAGMMDRQTTAMSTLSEVLREFHISLPEKIVLGATYDIHITGGEFIKEAKDMFTQIAQDEVIRQIHKHINPTTGETIPQHN